ncbi:MAG: hypothetical protein Q8L05_10370 [Actinomycetota bacterium]|nr:hypothetical protein [Actinomycetota bacterium]MDP2287608.1 hypothetical protein [Actinomycetota bacterium]
MSRQIEAVRDASGIVTGVLVAQTHFPDRIYSLDELRLRVNGLRNIAIRYGGRLLIAEGRIEAWSVGVLANRVTISIPDLEALQLFSEPRVAGVFMSILEESERKLFQWLNSLPGFTSEITETDE